MQRRLRRVWHRFAYTRGQAVQAVFHKQLTVHQQQQKQDRGRSMVAGGEGRRPERALLSSTVASAESAAQDEGRIAPGGRWGTDAIHMDEEGEGEGKGKGASRSLADDPAAASSSGTVSDDPAAASSSGTVSDVSRGGRTSTAGGGAAAVEPHQWPHEDDAFGTIMQVGVGIAACMGWDDERVCMGGGRRSYSLRRAHSLQMDR